MSQDAAKSSTGASTYAEAPAWEQARRLGSDATPTGFVPLLVSNQEGTVAIVVWQINEKVPTVWAQIWTEENGMGPAVQIGQASSAEYPRVFPPGQSPVPKTSTYELEPPRAVLVGNHALVTWQERVRVTEGENSETVSLFHVVEFDGQTATTLPIVDQVLQASMLEGYEGTLFQVTLGSSGNQAMLAFQTFNNPIELEFEKYVNDIYAVPFDLEKGLGTLQLAFRKPFSAGQILFDEHHLAVAKNGQATYAFLDYDSAAGRDVVRGVFYEPIEAKWRPLHRTSTAVSLELGQENYFLGDTPAQSKLYAVAIGDGQSAIGFGSRQEQRRKPMIVRCRVDGNCTDPEALNEAETFEIDPRMSLAMNAQGMIAASWSVAPYSYARQFDPARGWSELAVLPNVTAPKAAIQQDGKAMVAGLFFEPPLPGNGSEEALALGLPLVSLQSLYWDGADWKMPQGLPGSVAGAVESNNSPISGDFSLVSSAGGGFSAIWRSLETAAGPGGLWTNHYEGTR